MTSIVFSSRREQHASVHGNSYGTSVKEVERVQSANKVCLLDIDTQGVRLIRAQAEANALLRPHYVFIAPPSITVLEERLRYIQELLYPVGLYACITLSKCAY